MPDALNFTENDAANRLLAANPAATVIGMLLDQRFPMERAFLAPYLLQERLGKPLTAGAVADLDDDRLEEIFRGPPALHRFPVSMGTRARDLCRHIVEEYDGDPARIWGEAADGADLVKRLRALPGFGEAKTRVFVGIIAKRLEAAPAGWEPHAAEWRTIADVDSFEQIAELRATKEERMAVKKAAEQARKQRS
jgi:uncharacterized HhH-GPD family protein